LLGPSGVGKTTLGDTFLGLLPPVSGRVNWLGRRLDRKTSRELRPRFQKLHQDPASVFPPDRSFRNSLNDQRRLANGAELVRGLPALLQRLGNIARGNDRSVMVTCIAQMKAPGEMVGIDRPALCQQANQLTVGLDANQCLGDAQAPPFFKPQVGERELITGIEGASTAVA
jgi:ABC-type dipeptide/oligopeptide/nickel transport system ATPase subunit